MTIDWNYLISGQFLLGLFVFVCACAVSWFQYRAAVARNALRQMKRELLELLDELEGQRT